MTDKMLIAIAAGGTAGHVNPALALADELASRGHDVRFFGETRRLEGKLVPEAGFGFFPVEVTGFDRARPWTLITALAHLSREERRLVRTFKQNPALKPDVAIGFGAYVELPLVRAAAKLGIPVVLHEQNSVPGLANKQSAKIASLVAIAQPSVHPIFEHAGAKRIEFTGNPVRASVLAGERARGREALDIPRDATVLLVARLVPSISTSAWLRLNLSSWHARTSMWFIPPVRTAMMTRRQRLPLPKPISIDIA